MIHSLLLLLILLGLAVPAQAATYYVAKNGNNTNSCGTASAGNGCSGGTCSKLTIAAGIACMAGGDTLLINSGTYTQDPIAGPPTGTAAQRTIVRSMTGKANTTLISNDISLDALVYMNGHNYIEVDGFTFDGNNLSHTPIGGGSGNDITIKNSTATRGRHHGAEVVKNLQRWVINNVEFHHNGNPSSDLQHGMYFSAQNLTIKNSYFHDNPCWGMQIQTGEGDPPVPQSNKVIGNIFEGNGCGGLTAQQGSNHQIINNIFTNVGTLYAPNNSYFDFASPNALVYNNTFYCSTMREIEYATGGAIVANNLFYCPGTTLTIQRRTGGTFGATYTNNLLNQNPNFVNVNAPTTGGFKLNAGSIAINATTCRAEANPDAAGVARPQPSNGQCDYGAYEFTTGGGGPTEPPPSSPIVVYVAPTGLDSRTCTEATSQSTPRQTLAGGIACLTVPASTLFLRAGTYTEAFDSGVAAIAGGNSFTEPTKIAAFGTEVVTIKAPAVDQALFLFRMAATDHYIMLDRLILDCDNVSGTNAVGLKTGAHHIRVQNSKIQGCYYESIFVQDSDNNEFVGNEIHDSVVLSCIGLDPGSDNTLIEGNAMEGCAGSGISAKSTNVGTIIRGNYISRVGARQSRAGIVLTGANAPLVTNNIIWASFGGIDLATGTANAKVYNNTIYGSTGDGLQVDSGVTTTALTNNIAASSGGTNILNNGTGTTQTTNLTTAPAFVNAGIGDFHLQATASTAIDTGTTLATDVPKDQEGNTRPQPAGGAYDIGAYEFTGTPGIPPVEPPPPSGVGGAASWRGQAFFW